MFDKELLKEILNKELKGEEKEEVLNKSKDLLSKGFTSLVIATDKGNIVCGTKLNVIALIGTTLTDLYEKGHLSKEDLDIIFKGILEISEKNKNNKEDDNNDMEKELKDILEKLKKVFD